MYKILFSAIIVFGIGINGCKPQTSDRELDAKLFLVQKSYSEDLQFFKKEFTIHFPKSTDKNLVNVFCSRSPDMGLLMLDVTSRYDKSSDSKWIKQAIASYRADDSCLLVANKFATSQEYYRIKVSSEQKNRIEETWCPEYLPIPNFYGYIEQTDSTLCKLPADFTLYILEAKKGKFIEEKLLSSGDFMPNSWMHGFSRGVAISEKRNQIKYWIIIW